jgi:hypothetical protein
VCSGQAIAAGVKISYATKRVLLARLAAKGLVASPTRGWFAVTDEASVTTPAHGRSGVTAVASVWGD